MIRIRVRKRVRFESLRNSWDQINPTNPSTHCPTDLPLQERRRVEREDLARAEAQKKAEVQKKLAVKEAADKRRMERRNTKRAEKEARVEF